MKHPKSESAGVIDFSRMRKTPPHSPAHWLFALLLLSAYVGALWQHAHAGLTLGLLAAVPAAAAAVCIPYRLVGSLARSIGNCLLFGGAVGWAAWRMKSSFPDLAMVEGLCIASLMFIAGGRPKDYFYLFFISIFLLIYGALVPRMAHLNCSCLAAVLLFVLALGFRSSALAGRPVIREIRSEPVRRWHPAVIQLILSAVFFWLVFAAMPLRDNDVPGLFETSFLTGRETALPPETGSWLRPKKVKVSERAGNAYSGETPVKPTAAGSQGTPVNLKNSAAKSIIDGSGSASQGQDLVFYVKSPVKLYHLARLYDFYDGVQWRASARLERVKIRDYGPGAKVRLHSVEQKYTLVKLLSKRLYAGFMPVSIIMENPAAWSAIKSSFYGAELLLPGTAPLSYTASVQVIIPARSTEFSFHETASVPRTGKTLPPHDGKAVRSRIPDPAWNESASKHRYLELPRGKISSRVRQLAASIVKNVHTSYGRALALRDYLRKNYPYKLNAAPVPPGKEPADYFLFELKEGHCEYFACALAVLARSAGLPSRVATGFSPGNYNTLSNLFEVYEYHAHAWTQIYIEQMGWLTMDATPPSSVPSRSLPAGLGQLRDPFDDEWRITPPELTKKTQDLLKNDWLEKLGSRKDELSKIDSALVKVAEAQEKIQDEVREKYRGTMKRIRKSRETGLIFQMKAIWNKTVSFFGNLLSAFYDFIFSAGLLLLAVLLLAAAGFNFFRILSASRRYRRTVFRMERLRSEAESLWEKDPRRAVLSIYTALRLSLKLAGFERGTLELLDFADRLAEADPRLSESARELFLLYYQAEYGFRDLTSQAARRAIALYDSVQEPNRSAD